MSAKRKRRLFKYPLLPLRRLLALLTRPVRTSRGKGAMRLYPYRGYGTAEHVYIMGRVWRQPSLNPEGRSGLIRDLLNTLRHILRWGVKNARVRARMGTADECVETDGDGYFRLNLSPGPLEEADGPWHKADLELVEPRRKREVAGCAEVYIPPATAEFLVISDIDDTVMFTGVANKVKMLWRLFATPAESRVAFRGVASLYRALFEGASGEAQNPMLYVSRAPWSIYDVLTEFFRHHKIPEGPILFLREWGVSAQSPLPRKDAEHKTRLIRHMLDIYRDLPVVLIGDSGQRDPEIYAQTVHDYPERVRAVYIRNVSHTPERESAIRDLGAELEKAGSPLVLAPDSLAVAEHAAELGLIRREHLQRIAEETQRDVALEKADQ